MISPTPGLSVGTQTQRDEPELQMTLKQIEGGLNDAHVHAALLVDAYHRLRNPTPKEVGRTEQPISISSTVEGRLNAILGQLSDLNVKLNELVNAFNRAI